MRRPGRSPDRLTASGVVCINNVIPAQAGIQNGHEAVVDA